MSVPKLVNGNEGHVCFRLLAPNVLSTVEVPTERDPRSGEPTAFVTEQRVDGTIDTGETNCQYARIVAFNPDGTINATGFNARGEARQWIGIHVGAQPVPVVDPGKEDPAGHTFHLTPDCPWGR